VDTTLVSIRAKLVMLVIDGQRVSSAWEQVSGRLPVTGAALSWGKPRLRNALASLGWRTVRPPAQGGVVVLLPPGRRLDDRAYRRLFGR
jgi:hypothetical protein